MLSEQKSAVAVLKKRECKLLDAALGYFYWKVLFHNGHKFPTSSAEKEKITLIHSTGFTLRSRAMLLKAVRWLHRIVQSLLS